MPTYKIPATHYVYLRWWLVEQRRISRSTEVGPAPKYELIRAPTAKAHIVTILFIFQTEFNKGFFFLFWFLNLFHLISFTVWFGKHCPLMLMLCAVCWQICKCLSMMLSHVSRLSSVSAEALPDISGSLREIAIQLPNNCKGYILIIRD